MMFIVFCVVIIKYWNTIYSICTKFFKFLFEEIIGEGIELILLIIFAIIIVVVGGIFNLIILPALFFYLTYKIIVFLKNKLF